MLTREELGTVTPGPSRDGQVVGRGCVVGDGVREGTTLMVARLIVEEGEIELGVASSEVSEIDSTVLAVVCCTDTKEEMEEGVGCSVMDIVG